MIGRSSVIRVKFAQIAAGTAPLQVAPVIRFRLNQAGPARANAFSIRIILPVAIFAAQTVKRSLAGNHNMLPPQKPEMSRI